MSACSASRFWERRTLAVAVTLETEPDAFGALYADAIRRTDEEWKDWLANGGKQIKACVAAPNEGAIRFYRRNGYTIGPASGRLRPALPETASGSYLPVASLQSHPYQCGGCSADYPFGECAAVSRRIPRRSRRSSTAARKQVSLMVRRNPPGARAISRLRIGR